MTTTVDGNVSVRAVAKTFASGKTEKLVYQTLAECEFPSGKVRSLIHRKRVSYAARSKEGVYFETVTGEWVSRGEGVKRAVWKASFFFFELANLSGEDCCVLKALDCTKILRKVLARGKQNWVEKERRWVEG